MANVIDILINAIWKGGTAVSTAGQDLREFSNNAASSSSELEGVSQQASAAEQKLLDLVDAVSAGNLTTAEAQEEWDRYAESLTSVGNQAPKTGDNIKAIAKEVFAVTAAITAGTIAARKLYNALKEGAAIELTERRFDRLATSIGTTGEALERDLSIATRGMVSDLEAVQTATELMVQGLVDSHDEAVRLTAITAELGFNLNQLGQALSSGTTRNFDSLGLSVDGFAEKVEKLEDAGLAADEAFKLAFIEQAEEQIERVGSKAETTAGQIAQIEANWSNMINATKQSAAESAGPVIEFFARPIQLANDAEKAARDFGAAIGDTTAQQQAINELTKAVREFESASLEGAVASQASIEQVDQAVLQVAAAIASTTDDLDEQKELLADYGIEVSNVTFGVGGLVVRTNDLAAAIAAIRMQELVDEAQDADRALGLLADTEQDAIEDTSALREEMEKLADAVAELDFQDFLDRAGVSDETFTRLAFAMGGAANATEYLKKVMQDAGQVTDDLTVSAEDLEAALEAQREAQQERARLFLDFQDDLTTISVREGERREQAEADYEERRTEIVTRYGRTRAQEEEDFQRARARAEAQYQDDIAEVTADSAERQAELRARANDRLADLDRDHLQRMQDIIEDADIQLQEAAGRLDAAAVVAIQRQREKALEDEQQSFEDSRADIQRSLEQQLEAEQEAAAERLADLERFHNERQRLEDEDRAIRLEREQEAHDERLAQLDDQQRERLDQIRDQGQEEREARNTQYEQFWTDREGIEQERMEAILEAERQWWDDREALIPGATGGTGPDPIFGNAAAPTSLPDQFFRTASTNVGGVTINISGADSPEATGDAVYNRLLEVFETFNK